MWLLANIGKLLPLFVSSEESSVCIDFNSERVSHSVRCWMFFVTACQMAAHSPLPPGTSEAALLPAFQSRENVTCA
uniref:Putative secreted protein n=1 Tax=Anopheles marajoara TaxID=58244 RepID=A0A2M4CCN8_9DIPT